MSDILSHFNIGYLKCFLNGLTLPLPLSMTAKLFQQFFKKHSWRGWRYAQTARLTMAPYLNWVSILCYWSWKNDLALLICLVFLRTCMAQWTSSRYQNKSSLDAVINSSTVWFRISSRWMAVLAMHVNNSMYDLFCLEFSFS